MSTKNSESILCIATYLQGSKPLTLAQEWLIRETFSAVTSCPQFAGQTAACTGTLLSGGISAALVAFRPIVDKYGGRFTIVHPRDTYSLWEHKGLGCESMVPTNPHGEI